MERKKNGGEKMAGTHALNKNNYRRKADHNYQRGRHELQESAWRALQKTAEKKNRRYNKPNASALGLPWAHPQGAA